MKRLLYTFKWHGRFDIQDERQDPEHRQLVKNVIAQLKAGNVAMLSWEETHHERQDNHCDQTEAVTQPHTIIEIRLPIHEDHEIDQHDGGDDAFSYALETLESSNHEACFDYMYSCGDEPNTKDVIGIWVVYHNSETEYTGPHDIEDHVRDLDH